MKAFYHCINSKMILTADEPPDSTWIETPPPDSDGIYCWRNGAWVLSDESHTVTVHTYSKLKLLRKLKSLNLWDSIKNALETAGAYDEWLVAQDLASNDPLLVAMLTQFKNQFPEQDADAILADCEV